MIAQAEIAPVALALHLWRDIVADRPVVVFVDNTSAVGAIAKGYSPHRASAKLVGSIWLLCAEHNVALWVEWVPGPSNPADGPSRLRFAEAERLGAEVVGLPRDAWALAGG